MRNFFLILNCLFLISASFISCHTSYQTSTLHYKDYQINEKQPLNKNLENLLQPYSDSVNRSMDVMVGKVPVTLNKKAPESTLGNFMADAFFIMAKEKYNTHIDAAFMNFGGIRLTQLPSGTVTRSKIFELMPFDNLLVLQKLKGSVLQQFLDLTASRGGWPVSGISMHIRDNKAVNVFVDGKPLDPNATYTTANSDFIANGGDNADMLRQVPQITNGYLMRDALFDYIKKLKSEGKDISATIENRVVNDK